MAAHVAPGWARTPEAAAKRARVARLRAAKPGAPVLCHVTPDQLEQLRQWRSAGPGRAYVVSAVSGCMLREERPGELVEARYAHAGDACAAVAAGIQWRRVAPAVRPVPSARPKPGRRAKSGAALAKLAARAQIVSAPSSKPGPKR